MSIDRKTLLLHHANAMAVLRNPNLPASLHAKAVKARVAAEMLIELQNAKARKAEREAAEK